MSKKKLGMGFIFCMHINTKVSTSWHYHFWQKWSHISTLNQGNLTEFIYFFVWTKSQTNCCHRLKKNPTICENKKWVKVLPLKLNCCLDLIILKMKQVIWRHWQVKCKSEKDLKQNKVCGMNMWAEQHLLCTKIVRKLTDISNFTGNFPYLCQRFLSHTLISVLKKLNMILNSQKNLAVLQEFSCSRQVNFKNQKW